MRFDGTALRRAIKASGYSLAGFVREVQRHDGCELLAPQVLQRWLNGAEPDFRYLIAICEVTGRPVQAFARRERG